MKKLIPSMITKTLTDQEVDTIPRTDDNQRRIIFSNKAHFTLDRFVIKKNCIWPKENPLTFYAKHQQKCNVWCDFRANLTKKRYY